MSHGQHKHVQSSSGHHVSGHSPKLSSYMSSVNHGGFHKTHAMSSIHGGSGGKSLIFPKHSSFGHGSTHGGYGHDAHYASFGGGHKAESLLRVNEKETMQLLNDRLASYLEKVNSLEQENAQLEQKICEWYEKNSHIIVPDFHHYYKVIEELQCKIFVDTVENAKIVLQIDNARLASDDFKNKHEMELRLRTNVETDVHGLRKVLEGLNMERNDLEIQLQNLQDDLLQMKTTHEEEVNCLRTQLGARINVQVDAAPSVDLNQVLSEIREQYENMMERNLREVESMFLQRIEDLNYQVVSGSEQLESVQTEVIELKRCVQTLEIELQSQLSMKAALECSLAETEASYSNQLAQLQCLIDGVEEELSQVRSDLERQIHEYKVLMDQKTYLEMEIATYKRLLEGQDGQQRQHCIQGPQISVANDVTPSSPQHQPSTPEAEHGTTMTLQEHGHQGK